MERRQTNWRSTPGRNGDGGNQWEKRGRPVTRRASESVEKEPRTRRKVLRSLGPKGRGGKLRGKKHQILEQATKRRGKIREEETNHSITELKVLLGKLCQCEGGNRQVSVVRETSKRGRD